MLIQADAYSIYAYGNSCQTRNYTNCEGDMDSHDTNIKSERETRRWGVEKRLEFIEFRLYWEGRINRIDLRNVFDISIPQASADLSKYQDIAPGNMLYNTREKHYYASDEFNPVIIEPSTDQYFLRYFVVNMELVEPEKSYLGSIPPVGQVPKMWRRVEVQVFRKVLNAMRNKLALQILYQSMKKPEPKKRWISPHALGFDGFRWHCRAYCHIDNIFKDYVFGRILDIYNEEYRGIDPDDDDEWNTIIKYTIVPNPSLSEGQQRAIEYEYGMENGKLTIEVRKAMQMYLLNRLDISEKEKNKEGYIPYLKIHEFPRE